VFPKNRSWKVISEVKGIRSEEKIGYFQKNRSWKMISEVKGREFEDRRKSGISKKTGVGK